MPNDKPGTLSGSGIRTLPLDRVDSILRHIKEARSGKSRRIRSVRYRVTGFRNPDGGDWISRNPRNGQYYRVADGRHRTPIRPNGDMMRRTDMIALEVEIDRGQGSRIHYVSVPGL